MKGVLLIPCVAPMQSWGTRSRFQERDTEREPSKSGIIGLLCAALGRDRSQAVDDLAALRMGVRVDREGKLSNDFQTAQDVAVAGGNGTQNLLSNRQYLADAAFLVALEGQMDLLKTLHSALHAPVWPLYFGRKSYIPAEPVFLTDGIVPDVGLREALLQRELLLSHHERKWRMKNGGPGAGNLIRLVLETAEPTHERRNDHPISFGFGTRKFRERFVTTEMVDMKLFSKEGEEDVPFSSHP